MPSDVVRNETGKNSSQKHEQKHQLHDCRADTLAAALLTMAVVTEEFQTVTKGRAVREQIGTWVPLVLDFKLTFSCYTLRNPYC